MKKLLSCLLALCLLVGSAIAEPAHQFSYMLKLNVHEENLGTPHAKAWQTFLEKFAIKGEVKFEKLFTKEEKIENTSDILLNGKTLLHLYTTGNQQYVTMLTDAIANKFLMLNFHNYYEFMLKGYFFLNLPTQYIALLTYPFGAFKAVKNIYDFVQTNLNAKETTEIPYTTLQAIAQKVSTFLDDEYITYQFLRTLLMESGLFEMMYGDFQNANGYLETFAQEQPVQVSVENGTTTYTLNGFEVLKHTKTGNKAQYNLALPTSPNELSYSANATLETVADNLNANVQFTMGMEGSNAVNVEVQATGLPMPKSKQASGGISIQMNGDMATSHALHFAHTFEKNNQGEIKATLSLLNEENGSPMFTLSFNGHLEQTDEPINTIQVPSSDMEFDFFSLNDSALKTLKADLYPFLKSAFFPLLIETPFGVVADVLNFLDSSGVLATLFAK